MNNQLLADVKPWYRYPWPWFLMLGPFIVVVAGIATVYVAFENDDALVADDYYKQGLAINQDTSRLRRARELGLQAEFTQDEKAGTIHVDLRQSSSAPFIFPESLSLSIIHPTRGGQDQSLPLKGDGQGGYVATLKTPLVGRWRIALEDKPREWRLVGDWVIGKMPSLRLPEAGGRNYKG